MTENEQKFIKAYRQVLDTPSAMPISSMMESPMVLMIDTKGLQDKFGRKIYSYFKGDYRKPSGQTYKMRVDSLWKKALLDLSRLSDAVGVKLDVSLFSSGENSAGKSASQKVFPGTDDQLLQQVQRILQVKTGFGFSTYTKQLDPEIISVILDPRIAQKFPEFNTPFFQGRGRNKREAKIELAKLIYKTLS